MEFPPIPKEFTQSQRRDLERIQKSIEEKKRARRTQITISKLKRGLTSTTRKNTQAKLQYIDQITGIAQARGLLPKAAPAPVPLARAPLNSVTESSSESEESQGTESSSSQVSSSSNKSNNGSIPRRTIAAPIPQQIQAVNVAPNAIVKEEALPQLQIEAEEIPELIEEIAKKNEIQQQVSIEQAPAEIEPECLTLYDPCTREPISDIAALEKRVRELKQKKLELLDVRVELPANIVTRLDLLLMILNRESPPDETLLQYKLGGQTGQIFEAYWDIIFSLGLINKYQINDKFYMYNGNIDGITSMDDAKLVQNAVLYLGSRNVNMGASGASDITFVYKENKEAIESDPCSYSSVTIKKKPKFIFCSSKFYKNDRQKSIDKYDIQNIFTSAKNLQTDYDYDIVLLVQDPVAVKDKIKTAIRQYISEEASEVYGVDDLIHSLRKFYDFIKTKKLQGTSLTRESFSELMGIEKRVKPILNLRLHQEIAVQKISKGVREFKSTSGRNNKFLVGILPRGGKTYIAGGIVREMKPSRVVVLLGAKSETLEQFKADLFEQFQDFDEYTVLDVKEETPSFELDPSKKYIFIMSVELYKNQNTTRKLLVDLKSEGANKADLFICDEAHLKQVTARADVEMQKGTTIQDENELKQIDSIIQRSIPVVYMTGTYLRPLSAFKIPVENVVIWDYQDLQNGKKITENDEYFKNLYGEIYTNALTKLFSYGETLETISAVYKKFPDLHLLTTQFSEEARKAFSDQGQGRGFTTIAQTFELKKGFTVKTIPEPQNWANGFKNIKSIMRLINYLAPPDTAIRQIDGNEIEDVGSVIKSIDKISQRVGDRLAYLSTDFIVHSQIWFLAHSQSDLLQNRMPALASAIFRNAWFRKNFYVLAVSGVNWRELFGTNKIRIPSIDDATSYGTLLLSCPNSGESLKQCILREEREARNKGKGLIILAQNMLQVGISLPCADVVVLLDSGENVDDRIQKMFRALTESPMKKAGFIVDMNYFRTVKAIMDYEISSYKVKKNKRSVSSQEALTLFNTFMELYYIDDDKRVLKTDIQATIPEIQTLIEREGVGNMRIENIGRMVNTEIRNVLNSEYSKLYEELLGYIESEKEKKRILREEGQGVEKAEAENENEGENHSEREENQQNKSIPKLFNNSLPEQKKKDAFIDIFQVILKMGVFTTDKTSLQELLSFIKEDEAFREVIYETLINRGTITIPSTPEKIEEQREILFNAIIIPNLEKMISKGREGSYADMKGHFNRSEDMQDRIDNVLKYINDHLAPKEKERHKFGEVFTPLSLVDEMLSRLPKEVWTNPELKWLDPANGMGNFPIKAFLGQDTGEHKYPGLFEGLKESIPNERERRKHIVENMLFMIDINTKNNKIARTLFEKLSPGSNPNIEQIDKRNGFLADKQLVFNGKTIEHFDIIMGNPPYQAGAVKSIGTKKTRKMRAETGLTTDLNKNLWIPFVDKIIKNNLNENGYLIFITPIGWFKADGMKIQVDIHNLILSKQLHYIRILDQGQALKKFGEAGKIAVSYYLLQNKNPDSKTTIKDILDNEEKIQLNINSIIVRAYNSIFNKIVEKSPLWKDTEDYKQKSLSKNDCKNGGTFKNIQKVGNDGYIYIIRTDKKIDTLEEPKIYIDGYSYPRFFYDKDGEYGIIDQNQHYLIGKKLNKQVDYFKTKLSALILKYVKYRQEFIEPRYYPDVRELPIEKINDETLAEYFNFTEKEIKDIESMEYPHREYTFKELSCVQIKAERSEEVTEGGYRTRYSKTRKNRRC